MTFHYKKVPFNRYFSLDHSKMMQNKLLSIDAELEEDQFKVNMH